LTGAPDGRTRSPSTRARSWLPLSGFVAAGVVAGVEDGDQAVGGEVVEDFAGAALGLVEARPVHGVFHAGAGVEDEDGGDGLLAAERHAAGGEPRPGQRQTQRRDQQHAQRQQQQVLQADFALVDARLLAEEAERGEGKPLRLLPHDEVQQDRHADQDKPTEHVPVDERHGS